VECEQGASFGFTGKQVIHPSQLSIVHEAFSPSLKVVEHAIRLMERNSKEVTSGAWEFEGKMVDQPVIKNATHTIFLAHRLKVHTEIVGPFLEKNQGIVSTPSI
jgi:citrate lyase subunit beta-like protein